MAIVYKTKKLPGVLHTKWEETPCSPSSFSTSSHVRKHFYSGSHTRDRRIKPDIPVLSPTNRGTVFRASVQSAVNTEHFRQRWWCGPPTNGYVIRKGQIDRRWDSWYDYNYEPANVADTNALLSARQDLFSLSDTLAEFDETLGMFGDFAKGLKRIYDMSKGRWRRRRIKPTDAASANLAMSFGLQPLVGTLYDGLLLFKDRMNQDILRRNVGYDKVTAFKRWDGGINSGWSETSSEFQIRTIIYTKVSPNMRDRIDFGNPLRWAWERIPFSFVVDYGINIGDTLAALDRLPGISFVTGTRSVQAIHYTKFGNNDTRSNPAFNIVKTPGISSYSTYKRTKLYSFPLPDRPQWKPSSSFKRFLNMTSILALMRRDINRFR